MLTIDFDLSGIRKACEAANRAVRFGVQAGVEKGTKEGVAASRGRYKDKSGQLTRTAVGMLTRVTQSAAEGVMAWPQKYASFVDAGTQAHWIRPKAPYGTRKAARLPGQGVRARTDIGTHRIALRWFSGGVVRFASKVFHPGTRATGFAALAYQKCEAVIIREVELAVARAESLFRAN
jgi:hypothetical protein